MVWRHVAGEVGCWYLQGIYQYAISIMYVYIKTPALKISIIMSWTSFLQYPIYCHFHQWLAFCHSRVRTLTTSTLWANYSLAALAPATITQETDVSNARDTHQLIMVFNILHIVALVLLGAILLTVLLSSKIRRTVTWLGLIATFLLISLSNIFLIGQQIGPDPRFGVCLMQAGLIYAAPAMLCPFHNHSCGIPIDNYCYTQGRVLWGAFILQVNVHIWNWSRSNVHRLF
jgi:hypothetical protein